jgi:hypothetical protein
LNTSKENAKSENDLLEKLYTPKELDERGIISLVYQWQMRKSGKLNYYKLGTKILYSEKHLKDFFALCEQGESNEDGEK